MEECRPRGSSCGSQSAQRSMGLMTKGGSRGLTDQEGLCARLARPARI